MDSVDHNRSHSSGSRQALWPGLLLGFLLTLFVGAFVYAAYLFLTWGQMAVASVPEMPPLPLPKLVQAAPATDGTETDSLASLFPPMDRKSQETSPALKDRVTVLLMGVDNRPGQKVARTDTIILMTIDPQTGSAGVLSLPRDMLVSVPALDDSVKINTVHVLGEIRNYPGGGPAMLRDTVSDMLGYPIDYYVRVNFDGFRQIVDLIGGIDIEVPREIRDDKFPDDNYGFDPLYIPAGLQRMDGALALKYARTRHLDSDYYRAARQQQVIMAVKDKITQPGQLAALLPRLPGLALAMANSVQTDMPVERAIMLARAVGQMDLQNPTRIVVDGTFGTTTMDPAKGYILVPDMKKLRAAAAAVFGEKLGGPSAEEVARQAVQMEAARVVVLNGTSEDGLGTEIAAGLSGKGFNVVAVGNAERADYGETWLITYGDGKEKTREALVSRFNITPDHIRSDLSSESADLTLVIGADQATAGAGG